MRRLRAMALAADAILEDERALAFACSATLASTFAPLTMGLPTVTFSPSATINTLSISTFAPTSCGRCSTCTFSPTSARY
jgi:hypothetical protein